MKLFDPITSVEIDWVWKLSQLERY